MNMLCIGGTPKWVNLGNGKITAIFDNNQFWAHPLSKIIALTFLPSFGKP